VIVQPANDTIVVGQQLEFHAVALDASGRPVPNVRFVWTSSQPRVAPVDPTSPDDSTRATAIRLARPRSSRPRKACEAIRRRSS
jgi:hypothetical protein